MKAALIAGLVLLACKDPGTAAIDIQFGQCTGRDAATNVRVYLIADATCASCQCGNCFDACATDNCTIACDGNDCSTDALEAGLTLDPPGSGLYATIFEYTYQQGNVRRIGASACAELVLDADGTKDLMFEAETACCVGREGDAGIDAR